MESDEVMRQIKSYAREFTAFRLLVESFLVIIFGLLSYSLYRDGSKIGLILSTVAFFVLAYVAWNLVTREDEDDKERDDFYKDV